MIKDKNYDVDRYAWPGGYEFKFLCENGDVLCYECSILAFQNHDEKTTAFIHWEGESLWCDDCGVELESEYGIPE